VFRDRLITAAVLVPLVVAAIYWVRTPVLAWFLAAIILVGAWEWAALMGLVPTWQRLLYVGVIAALLALAAPLYRHDGALLPLLSVVMLCWTAALAWIIYLNHHGPVSHRSVPIILSGLAGIWLLLPTWLAVLWLHGRYAGGPSSVLLLMLLVWGADGGAYFAGRKWGRRKLAFQLSPGKTWEGVAGGMLLGLVLVLPLSAWLYGPAVTGRSLFWPTYMLLCLVTIAYSIVGDLFESVAKRHAGVKDSGQILPGHGGVLDRIDSLTVAAPCYSLGLLALSSGGDA
jgi:phosphatidate cytidylyltransferase